eukprot:TRINITY_DN15899_c1_g1_i1.p3 TRINITY_DN15899_c1_g1~~TRINITY_DN15899_c1_g1_i1.p3  ORF type:complete len:107 (+),score=6.70 TRINITY_DN15899_c1_g1_i1:282-602(+)
MLVDAGPTGAKDMSAAFAKDRAKMCDQVADVRSASSARSATFLTPRSARHLSGAKSAGHGRSRGGSSLPKEVAIITSIQSMDISTLAWSRMSPRGTSGTITDAHHT